MQYLRTALTLMTTIGFLSLFGSPAFAANATFTIVQDGSSTQKIPGATVRVYKHPQSQATPAYDKKQTTNNQGQTTFTGLVHNGVYLIQLSKRGCTFPSQDQNLGIPNNQNSVTKTMKLDCPPQPIAKALITVVQDGNANQKISGASVNVYKNPTSQFTPAYDKKEATNSQGNAGFTGLVNNGVYLVKIGKKGCTFPSQDQNLGIPNNKNSVTKTMRLNCRK